MKDLSGYIQAVTTEFHLISQDRKKILDSIADHISKKRRDQKKIDLVFICTHNSRRSHFGQIWAKTAARYYGISDVNTYSGGTEVTAFNPNAIEALRRAGMRIESTPDGKNPIHKVFYSEKEKPISCYSKTYNDTSNPSAGFAAIMTCNDAEQNCPVVAGAEFRASPTYDDPKQFDGTARQEVGYDLCCRQIARELFYMMSRVV